MLHGEEIANPAPPRSRHKGSTTAEAEDDGKRGRKASGTKPNHSTANQQRSVLVSFESVPGLCCFVRVAINIDTSGNKDRSSPQCAWQTKACMGRMRNASGISFELYMQGTAA